MTRQSQIYAPVLERVSPLDVRHASDERCYPCTHPRRGNNRHAPHTCGMTATVYYRADHQRWCENVPSARSVFPGDDYSRHRLPRPPVYVAPAPRFSSDEYEPAEPPVIEGRYSYAAERMPNLVRTMHVLRVLDTLCGLDEDLTSRLANLRRILWRDPD